MNDVQFAWQEEFNIGVSSIDREHRQLFRIINKLFALRKEEKDDQWACQEAIKFFKAHAVRHFADEESYMESIDYSDLEQHRRAHRGFRENTLPALEQELERTDYASDAVDHFLGVCAGWLIGHTMTEDAAIVGGRITKWKNLLPEQELKALEKLIIQLVFDMFHLESQLVSDVYGGEKFGRGVYYRLVYGIGQGKETQEILLVFEEKLLINTVGKVMGIKTNKLDTMLINASRYVAQQFAGRIIEHLPNAKEYKLKEDNLLSYDQFQKVFETEKPQVSLLFNTGGSGYFSYCAIAPHLFQSNIGIPLEHENAMNEVKKYLEKREKEEILCQKPKVLVVDDSVTVRQGIKQLLGSDYEVALAESGVAAIAPSP